MTAHRSATWIAAAVTSGEMRAADVVARSLERARAVQDRTNAFVTIADGPATARAEVVDRRVAAGEDLPLAGVPVVVKDNMCTSGILSTAASRSLAGFVPPYSATVVVRLEAAGAIVVAKANCDEFGMGSSNENSAYGPVRNPWDESRVPGGSSGGSAVAVATGVAPIALGTDTGGSVRQPASFTGILGYKPTYGLLSRYGVMSYASSLDQVGVLARTTGDVRRVMEIMLGRDARDATSVDPGARLQAALRGVETRAGMRDAPGDRTPLAGLRVGIVAELAGDGNSPGVLAALGRTRSALQELGAIVVEVSLPHARYGVPTYYLIATAEASSNLSRYDGTIYGARVGEDAAGQAEATMATRGASLGPEVQRRVLMGTFALSAGYRDAYYGKALAVRRILADEIAAALGAVDVLLTPTAPSVAFGLGERVEDPLAMYVGDVDSCLANLAGIPAVSVPAGEGDDGLPCGVQFMAPALHDERLWRVAAALEGRADARGEAGFAPLAPTAV